MDPLANMEQSVNFISGDTFDVKSLNRIYGFERIELSKLLNCTRQQVTVLRFNSRYKPRTEINRKKLHHLNKINSLLRVLLKKPSSGIEERELDKKIAHWFRIPNPAYPDVASPFELVAAGRGDVVIRSLLDQLHGAST